MPDPRGLVDEVVPSRLGPLHVSGRGSGPVALLWHSLFVDSTSWRRLESLLGDRRRLLLVDGPGHGRSPGVRRPFTLDDCAAAACDVLEHMGITGPVDWVGNAWGGHVGISFAAAHPDRCRSLVAVASPVTALGASERRQITLGRTTHRLLGPIGPVTHAVTDALLGSAADPTDVQLVSTAFRRADRRGMSEAIRSMSLRRPDLTPVLPLVEAPTLVVAGAGDPLWSRDQADAAAARLPRGSAAVAPGCGHVAPLLSSPEVLAALITDFWQATDRTAAAAR